MVESAQSAGAVAEEEPELLVADAQRQVGVVVGDDARPPEVLPHLELGEPERGAVVELQETVGGLGALSGALSSPAASARSTSAPISWNSVRNRASSSRAEPVDADRGGASPAPTA